MKKLPLITLVSLLAVLLVVNGQVQALTIPTFEIQGVTANDKVTIVTANFPAGYNFEVRMGLFGTKGVDGVLIGTVNSGSGGSLKWTFPIPAALQSESTIAIRLQSTLGGYYSYNWFTNADSGTHTGGVPIDETTAGPSITVTAVNPGEYAVIIANNLPADESFKVRMGVYGTQGIDGELIATVEPNAEGFLKQTYPIPFDLQDDAKIAVRFESEDSSLALYTWFDNVAGVSGGMGGPVTAYYGIPTISILEVNEDEDVTIKTNNYPADQDFQVLMGKIGTRGVGGILVTTINSGDGGSFEATFDIPEELQGDAQIAIRLQTADNTFYSYDWFYNSPDAASASASGGTTPLPGYTGIPTFSVSAVVADSKVTIQTSNFPAGFEWQVLMGKMGTKGVDGTEVATVSSTGGGAFSETFNIPAALQGEAQIAIRLQSTVGGFYAYNWFYNSTMP